MTTKRVIDHRSLVSESGGHYYSDGRQVFKAPIERIYSDGSHVHTMGFMVCECSEYVDGAADEIVTALNAQEGLTAP